MGYKHIPGLLAWRVSHLVPCGIWPTPGSTGGGSRRSSQDAALAHYGSQLQALEADWQLSAKLAAPAPEQFWRLAPPPPGMGAPERERIRHMKAGAPSCAGRAYSGRPTLWWGRLRLHDACDHPGEKLTMQTLDRDSVDTIDVLEPESAHRYKR